MSIRLSQSKSRGTQGQGEERKRRRSESATAAERRRSNRDQSLQPVLEDKVEERRESRRLSPERERVTRSTRASGFMKKSGTFGLLALQGDEERLDRENAKLLTNYYKQKISLPTSGDVKE